MSVILTELYGNDRLFFRVFSRDIREYLRNFFPKRGKVKNPANVFYHSSLDLDPHESSGCLISLSVTPRGDILRVTDRGHNINFHDSNSGVVLKTIATDTFFGVTECIADSSGRLYGSIMSGHCVHVIKDNTLLQTINVRFAEFLALSTDEKKLYVSSHDRVGMVSVYDTCNYRYLLSIGLTKLRRPQGIATLSTDCVLVGDSAFPPVIYAFDCNGTHINTFTLGITVNFNSFTVDQDDNIYVINNYNDYVTVLSSVDGHVISQFGGEYGLKTPLRVMILHSGLIAIRQADYTTNLLLFDSK